MVYLDLNKRQKEILDLLLKKQGYMEIEYLLKFLGCSKRSLYNDISAIKQFCKECGAELITKRGKGYYIDSSQKVEGEIISNKDINSEDTDQRVNSIIEILLYMKLTKKEAITLQEIADKVFVSLPTIKSDLKEVKDILKQSNLKIIRVKNEGIAIDGDEKYIRRFLSEFFKKVSRLEHLNMESINCIFDLKSNIFKFTTESILKIIERYKINLTDLAINNLCTHILITIYRVKNNNILKYENLYVDEDSIEYQVACELKEFLNGEFSVELPMEEVIYLYQHIASQKVLLVNYEYKNFDKEIIAIIEDINTKLFVYSGINFNLDQILLGGLAVHLRSAINRLKYGMKIENPMLNEIKSNYPFAYDIGVVFSRELEKKINTKISEDEIAFIALHYGGAFERLKIENKMKKISAIVVCATGGGTSILLKSKLERKFKDFLDIKGFYPAFKVDSLNLKGYDFIISTIPLEKKEVPVVTVSPILLDDDCKKISKFLNRATELDIKNLFCEDLFFINLAFTEKNQIIKFLSQKLFDKGYIDDEAKKSFVERENIGTTEIGNKVAIPHPMKGNILKLGIAIGILNEEVMWDKTKVQFVMMLAINSFENKEEVFLEIYSGVDNIKKVEKLIECKNFYEFIDRY